MAEARGVKRKRDDEARALRELDAALTAQLFGGADEESNEEIEPISKKGKVVPEKSDAWVDEEDLRVNLVHRQRRLKLRANPRETHVDGQQYQKRLRTQHAQLQKGDASWATKRDEESNLNSTTVPLVGGVALSPGTILVAAVVYPIQAKAVVRSLSFDERGELLLVAGLDKTLRLHALADGASVAQIHLPDLPVTSAHIHKGVIVAVGPRKHVYVHDLARNVSEKIALPPLCPAASFSALSPSGTLCAIAAGSYIAFLSIPTRAFFGHVQCAWAITTIAFKANGALLVAGKTGELSEWDPNTRRCVRKWTDHGALHTYALSTHADTFATGTHGGHVHLYANPTQAPRVLSPLVTDIDTLVVNHDGQLLVCASSKKGKALRLVHVGSGTAYKNFPPANAPLSRVTAAAFSPHSTHLAIGTARGKVLLYRLRAYTSRVDEDD